MFDQLTIIKQLLEIVTIPTIEHPVYEADDVIGTISSNKYFPDTTKYISSGDNDFIQLISNVVLVIREIQGKIIIIDKHSTHKKFSINPSQYVDYIALKGDQTDNVAGVPGIGPITAQRLLNEYTDIPTIISNTDRLTGKLADKIVEHRDRLLKNRSFLRINESTNIDEYTHDVENAYKANLLLSKTNDIIKEAGALLSDF